MPTHANQNRHTAQFRLGNLVATPGAIEALAASAQSAHEYLERHRSCDWGDVDTHDRKANDDAIAHEGDLERQGRLLSAYTTRLGQRIWIITEADRSVTTVLLPEEY